MVVIAILFLVAAFAVVEEDSDSSSDGDSSDSSDDDSDDEFDELFSFAVKGLLPSGVGGAIGAFAGFRFLWAKMPSSELISSTYASTQPVAAQPMVAEMVNIRCPNCSSQMQVQKLGKSQNVTCESCGNQGEVEV